MYSGFFSVIEMWTAWLELRNRCPSDPGNQDNLWMHYGGGIWNIKVVYYYIIWTDNWSTLPEVNTRRQDDKYPMIKVLRGCNLKLSLHSVNSVLILYRTGNMQSAILLSFAISFVPTAMWASMYPPANSLLYQSIPYITSMVWNYKKKWVERMETPLAANGWYFKKENVKCTTSESEEDVSK